MSLEKDRLYLILMLSKILPAYLSRHIPNDFDTEEDIRWIVYIDSPAGQLSWHIEDKDVHLFAHLDYEICAWDKHTTEEKYRRIRNWKEIKK